MLSYKIFCLLLWMGGSVYSAPAPPKTQSPPEEDPKVEAIDQPAEDMNTGLYYDQYLQKVIKLLESNEDFKKKMENADFDDIKNGKLSNEVNFMPQEIREQLNELKKQEVRRLRKIVHAKTDLDKGRKVQKSQYLSQIANHLDHDNPHTFEAADLTNLIKAATSDLENFDQERHEEFKKHEMEKEMKREEKMNMLNELDRQKAEEDFTKHQKEMAENNAIHHPASQDQLNEVWKSDDGLADEEFNPKTFFYLHGQLDGFPPGSKAQLEEVWDEEDGLNEQDFNPKTFFKLHDLNGDEYLDAMELEALFEKDLGNAYNESDPDFDYMEMEEERRRMREHVMKEVDKDNNGLISLQEFLIYTSSTEFANPVEDTYKTIDQLLSEHSLFTQEEMETYRKSIELQEAEIKQKLEALKAEARNLSSMRKELNEEKKSAAEDGNVEHHEKIMIEVKEEAIKQQEEKLQEIHKDLQQQSKDVLEMKQEVKKHEASEKISNQIKEKIESLPDGPEKEQALEDAKKQLENLRDAQAALGKQANELGRSEDEPGES